MQINEGELLRGLRPPQEVQRPERAGEDDLPPSCGECSVNRHPAPLAVQRRVSLNGNTVSTPPATGLVTPVRNTTEKFRSAARQVITVAEPAASTMEAVPVFGPMVKGPLEALIKILTAVEHRMQNVEDTKKLKEKFIHLNKKLEGCPADEEVDRLISNLDKKCRELDQLSQKGVLDHRNVASDISQCERDISYFISELLLIIIIKTHELVKQQEDSIIGLNAAFKQHAQQLENINQKLNQLLKGVHMTPGADLSIDIYIVDPFGTKHLFALLPSSYKDVEIAVLDRCKHDRVQRSILERYVDRFELNLIQGEDRRITVLAERDLCSLGTGATVIMSIITYSDKEADSVQCPLCKMFITVPDEDADRVFCQKCDSNVIVSRGVQWDDDSSGRETLEKRVSLKDLEHLSQLVVRPSATVRKSESSRQTEIEDGGGGGSLWPPPPGSPAPSGSQTGHKTTVNVLSTETNRPEGDSGGVNVAFITSGSSHARTVTPTDFQPSTSRRKPSHFKRFLNRLRFWRSNPAPYASSAPYDQYDLAEEPLYLTSSDQNPMLCEGAYSSPVRDNYDVRSSFQASLLEQGPPSSAHTAILEEVHSSPQQRRRCNWDSTSADTTHEFILELGTDHLESVRTVSADDLESVVDAGRLEAMTKTMNDIEHQLTELQTRLGLDSLEVDVERPISVLDNKLVEPERLTSGRQIDYLRPESLSHAIASILLEVDSN